MRRHLSNIHIGPTIDAGIGSAAGRGRIAGPVTFQGTAAVGVPGPARHALPV